MGEGLKTGFCSQSSAEPLGFCKTFLQLAFYYVKRSAEQNPKSTAEFWGTFGSPDPSSEDRLFSSRDFFLMRPSCWTRRVTCHDPIYVLGQGCTPKGCKGEDFPEALGCHLAGENRCKQQGQSSFADVQIHLCLMATLVLDRSVDSHATAHTLVGKDLVAFRSAVSQYSCVTRWLSGILRGLA